MNCWYCHSDKMVSSIGGYKYCRGCGNYLQQAHERQPPIKTHERIWLAITGILFAAIFVLVLIY